ncbi:aldolase catalytic domain-containing protein [Roseivirga pacifica]|uniref:aldolase catalytic domain-containing protein n=1 Tax=Roseivirga pacifica TaxID=1267423 RepID=UPI002094A90B|nr:aldolase catalytic domain-containing protein [Roseivirga pacifica]
MKILDCTLRDGGYYTNWDFKPALVETYFRAMQQLPIEYLEIGYRSRELANYLGQYFYCPEYVLENARRLTDKKLAVILNQKDFPASDVKEVLVPVKDYLDLVRVAVNPDNFDEALILATELKSHGFKVAFNVMYMSSWSENGAFIKELPQTSGLVDYFYMVDSFGGVFPADVKQTIKMVRNETDVVLGFHGHNNLELGLINTLTAIEEGVEIVDATITGMGRGAGNLKTELLLTALNAKHELEVNFDALTSVVEAFEQLQSQHGWGTNLPYMVSGANSLPQKDVMEWVTRRFYSFNSIIRALQNRKKGSQDNEKLPIFEQSSSYQNVLIVGGGPNAVDHAEAIKHWIGKQESVAIVHASSKNAKHYEELADTPQFFCLVGSEGHRLEKVFDQMVDFKGQCILPPYPREMGTYIPSALSGKSNELKEVTFTKVNKDTHTVLAIQAAIDLGATQVFMVGYDGYMEGNISQQEKSLSEENELVFKDFSDIAENSIVSLTPTNYKGLDVQSVYGKLV